MVARPLRHRLEALDELVVPQVLEQRRLLRDLDRRRLHVEAAVERVGRDVAGVVEQLVGVQPALAQQRDHRAHLVEVHRRRHQDEVAHGRVLVAGRVERRQHAAEAVAHRA